jgi:hypothetical protein
MGQMEIANWPMWPLWIIAASQIVFALAMIILAGVLLAMMKQMIAILGEMRSIVENDVHKDIMPQVTAITKNVKTMSDDAAQATHHVTSAVNHVSHVVDSVTQKLESPVIKTVGVLSGVVAGARALSGDKKSEKEKKRGGLLGFLGR